MKRPRWKARSGKQHRALVFNKALPCSRHLGQPCRPETPCKKEHSIVYPVNTTCGRHVVLPQLPVAVGGRLGKICAKCFL